MWDYFKASTDQLFWSCAPDCILTFSILPSLLFSPNHPQHFIHSQSILANCMYKQMPSSFPEDTTVYFILIKTCHVFFSPSLPALDWQLPSCSGPYNLQIEVQPKSHHRAHYETEGSRGAVKALSGGHPVVQVCDERCVMASESEH